MDTLGRIMPRARSKLIAARDLLLGLQQRMHAFVTWEQMNPVRQRRAPGRAFVFFERDGLARELMHREGPEQAGDGQEENPLGDVHAWANATTGQTRS